MGVDLGASVEAFLESVASDEPTPGGGSVAALSGAMGAALAAMVCRLTRGKKGYEDVQEEIGRLLAQSEALMRAFQTLVVEDASAYDSVSKAFRMERTSQEAKEARLRAIQDALREAAEVPFTTGETSLELLRHLILVAAKGNMNALSDAGVAAHLALASFQGARLNVIINLSSIKDPVFVTEKRRGLEALERQVKEAHAEILRLLRTRGNLV